MADTAGPWTLTARWVFPADRSPLPRGTITIQGDKIVAVEPAGTRAADEDLCNIAILPGLVNAHTHLDLSDARGKVLPTPDFTAWLRRVVSHRRHQSSDDVRLAISQGLTQIRSAGTTLVGDISSNSQSFPLIAASTMRAVVYRELLGQFGEETKKFYLDWAKGPYPAPNCRPGISPHAPYSVDQSMIKFTCASRLSFCIHLGETADELELLQSRTGPFVQFLKDLGAWQPEGLAPSIDWILTRVYRSRRRSGIGPSLFVHCNFVSTDAPLLSAGTVVYCPRTHAAFGHPRHPFREFLKRGVRVVLGTDSLASNPDLDILAEARFVAVRHPDLPGETLLRMITLDSAIALGWGDIAGSLTPGKSADLVVLPLPEREEADPHRLLFDSESRVRRVLFRGDWTV